MSVGDHVMGWGRMHGVVTRVSDNGRVYVEWHHPSERGALRGWFDASELRRAE